MAQKNEYKNILVAVSGLTPQIITETLYYYVVEKKINIHEIHIITTAEGERRLKEHFLVANSPYYQFCEEYQIFPSDIKIEITLIRDQNNNPLEDIRTREENELMAKTIMETVFTLTRNPHHRVVASIAGGRKTMSAYMALAMQLFAREQDVLTHVLVWPPELEFDRNFFFPTKEGDYVELSNGQKIEREAIRIDVAEIPIIKLRPIIENEFGGHIQNYLDLIELSQFKINELKQQLKGIWTIYQQSLTVHFGDNFFGPIHLSGKLAAIYHVFSKSPKPEQIYELVDQFKSVYHQYYLERESEKNWEKEQIQRDISKINDIIKKQLPPKIGEFFQIKSQDRQKDYKTYYIPLSPQIVEH